MFADISAVLTSGPGEIPTSRRNPCTLSAEIHLRLRMILAKASCNLEVVVADAGKTDAE